MGMCPLTGGPGWMYVEKSSITAANERLHEAEMEFQNLPEEQKAKSKKELIELGIYDQDWWNKDDLENMDKIQKILQGNHRIALNDAIVSRSALISLLTVQLGNPDVTSSDREKLAVLLETNGRITEPHRPRFYTYDDKPSFNLVSGIIQAKEDIWQKNSILGLQKEVVQLKNQVKTLKALPLLAAQRKKLGPEDDRSAPTGLTSSEIDNLKSKELQENDQIVGDVCSICHENMAKGETVHTFGCGNDHHYHKECIIPWLKLNRTCPLCRYTVPLAEGARENTVMDEDNKKMEELYEEARVPQPRLSA